jgi:HlyD family secretion protein
MKKKIIIGIVVLVVVAGVILGWTMLKGSKNGVVKYRTDKITKGDIQALVITSGTLNPITLVEVGSEVSGKIAKLYVDYNSQVKQGQVLAELDQSILQSRVDQNQANYLSSLASLERAKVTLEQLQKKYERSLSLAEKNLISFEEKELAEANYLGAKTDIQAAEARVEQSKSQLESSKLDLSHSIIRSPIDGVVISRIMNVGQTVQASFSAPKMFEIANDLNKMQVECSVDEADIGKVKEGQTVRFTVDSFPDDTFNGTVRQVRYAATVTQNVVTYATIVDVDNPGLKLRPGMTATVSIITGEAKGVLRISNAALRFTPNIPALELAKIMKEAGEKMFAKRKAEGQTEQGSGHQESSQAQTSAQGEQGGSRMMSSQGGGSFLQGMAGMGSGTQRKKPSMVWYLDENGKLNVTFIRPGVTDSTYTEMLRGELKEGQEIIVGEGSTTQTTASASSSGPGSRPPMMMIGR